MSVAPRTGARIETSRRRARRTGLRCRSPHGGADRNLSSRYRSGSVARSLPARGRGSKPRSAQALSPHSAVAPRTGARIETSKPQRADRKNRVAPRTGARIETSAFRGSTYRRRGRSPHGGADRNYRVAPVPRPRMGRSPHGGADRNSLGGDAILERQAVAPRTGARIETTSRGRRKCSCRRRSPHGGADRNNILPGSTAIGTSRSPHGGADRNAISSAFRP